MPVMDINETDSLMIVLVCQQLFDK